MKFKGPDGEVFATQLTEGNEADILSFMQETNCPFESTGYFQIEIHQTNGVTLNVEPDEWIVEEPNGIFTIYTDEHFKKTFEEA